MIRAVIDTHVLFEGLTHRGAAAEVVDAWVARAFTPCVSTAMALEYEEVLTNKLGPAKRHRAVGALQALMARSEYVAIWFAVRPVSPDPDDDFVIECAYNARAAIVTHNLKDLRAANEVLGLAVHTPVQFLDLMRGG